PTATGALGTGSKEDAISAVKTSAAGPKDSRVEMQKIYGNGQELVATDGRRLTRVVVPGFGTPDAPVQIDPKTGKSKPWDVEKKGRSPNFTAVIPKGQQFIGSIDAKELFNLVKLAEPFTSEKNLGISLWRNKDGSFGTTSEDGTRGSSEHNIKPNAKPVGRYQPQFLMDAANSLLRMGNDKIDIYHTDQLVPVEMRGKNAQVVIMPMRLEGETVAALPRSKTPPAHPEPLP